MEIESWKIINGFSKYEVSNFGNIRNSQTKICAVAWGKRNSAFGYKWIYSKC